MRAAVAIVVVAGCLALIALTGRSQVDSAGRYVLTGREAFLVLRPEIAAAQTVDSAKWSPGGHYVAVERHEMAMRPGDFEAALKHGRYREETTGEHSLTVWDRITGRTSVVWREATSNATLSEYDWMADGRSIIAELAVPPAPSAREAFTLTQIDVRTQTARTLLRWTAPDEVLVECSPSKPLAMIEKTHYDPGVDPESPDAHPAISFLLLRADGTITPVRLPDDKGVYAPAWSAAGDPIFMRAVRDSDTRKTVERHWYALDSTSMAVRELPEKPAFATTGSTELPITVNTAAVDIRRGASAHVSSALWLETVEKSDRPRALICADGSRPQLSPAGDAVLYFSQGALWVAQIVRMDRTAFLERWREIEKQAAMKGGKGLGMAIMMYVQDNDELIPSPDDLSNKLLPYADSGSMFDGFTYTYAGGALADIPNPVELELGYYALPGGRVVIYCDGHVVWVPNTAK